MNQKAKRYSAGTIGSIMSKKVPMCSPDTKFEEITELMFSSRWDSTHFIYVVGANNKLLGVIDIANLSGKKTNQVTAEKLMSPAEITISPTADQEKAVLYAIRDDVIAVPVVDKLGHLLGAVTASAIIDIMHEEHVEDALLSAGVNTRGPRIIERATKNIFMVVRARAPWLVIGLMLGLCLSLVSSQFEEALKNSIAIAYFIPVVAYVGGSVGAQSGAIAVRALALVKLSFVSYILREFTAGIFLGLIVGVTGFIGASLISGEQIIGLVVGLGLFMASIIATVIASLIPFVFKAMGKDPALGSGPIATACLDVLSLLSYFLLATALI